MLGTIFLYNFILLGSTFFIYLSETERTAMGRSICTLIAFLIVFLPAAFRYEIGIDYYSYTDIYNAIGAGNEVHIEPLYFYLNLILNSLGLPVEALFIVVAFIIYLFAFLSYPDKYKAIFHFMYIAVFYFNSFTFMRGNISIAIGLFAIMNYIKNKKTTQFYLLIVLAALFHKAVILVAFVPLVNNSLVSRLLTIGNLLIASLLLSLLFIGNEIINIIIDSNLANIFGYQGYLTHSYFSQKSELNSGLGVIAKLTPLFITILFFKKIHKRNPSSAPLIVIVICCITALIFSLFIRIFNRIEEVYAIAYIFSLYLIIKTPTIPLHRTIAALFMVFWFLTYNISIIRSPTDHNISCDGAKITPYVSIFDKKNSTRDALITRTNQGCKKFYQTKKAHHE